MLKTAFIKTPHAPARSGRASLVRLLSLALSALGGCIFTDPINVPPHISIDARGRLVRGEPATFIADVTDDQSEPVVVEWARTTQVCPPSTTDRTQWPGQRIKGGTTFTVDAPQTRDPFCMWAVAVDRHGATSAANFMAMPANHPPVALIDVENAAQADSRGDYPYLTEFRLSAAKSDDLDKDKLTKEWTLPGKPNGSQADLVPCLNNPSADVRCLPSDKDGVYQVEVKVGDATDSSTARVTLRVLRDTFPCITATKPDYDGGPVVRVLSTRDEGTSEVPPNAFEVLTVLDDLDPFPGDGGLRFSWSLSLGDNATVIPFEAGPRVTFPPDQFKPGDKAKIRVQVFDRTNAREIQMSLLACTSSLASPPKPCLAPPTRAFDQMAGCYLSVTWEVEYR